MTRVISVYEHDAAQQAAKVIAEGGVVVYPTETSYAIGCSALDRKAVKRVYELKKRDGSKALPVITASKAMTARFVELDSDADALIAAFMPGAFTLVCRKKKKAPKIYAGDDETLGFRISSNPFCRELSLLCDAPIISTSANVSGKGPAYSLEPVLVDFDGHVELIVSGGELHPRPPSTIVCLAYGLKFLREGSITKKQVQKALGKAGKTGKKNAKSTKRAVKRR